jgi:L-fuconolactonase
VNAGLIDAHHHLWDPARRQYPWMRGAALDPLRRRFDAADLRAVTTVAGVSRAVLVQTVSDEAETLEFLTTAATSGGLIAGVVGWVDLTASGVASRIAQLRAARGGELLVGIRHQVEDEPQDWLADPRVRAGLTAVAEAGLVYDLLVRPDQLDQAGAAVAATPGSWFVLDHGAKPPIGQPSWQSWVRDVRVLALRPNVAVKLSGLLTQVPTGAPLTDLLPSAQVLLEAFGPKRMMIGSDWPICTLAADYDTGLQVERQALAGLDDADRALVLGGTATAIYGLSVADAPDVFSRTTSDQ